MAVVHPPCYIVWSTDQVDLSDPFQKRWYLRQGPMRGHAEDIRQLDFDEIERELEGLDLPPEFYSRWKAFLNARLVKW